MMKTPGIPPYAELHCLSNYAFLRGASEPGELVERAQTLGYTALAITDECSLAGVVRAYSQLKRMQADEPERPLPKLLIGSEFIVRNQAGEPSF